MEEGEEDSSQPETIPADREGELWDGEIPDEVKDFYKQEKDRAKFATHLSLEEMHKNKPKGKLLRKYTGGMLVALRNAVWYDLPQLQGWTPLGVLIETVQKAKDIKILRGVEVDPLVVAQVALLTRNSHDLAYFDVLNYQGGWWVRDGKPEVEFPTKEGQGEDGVPDAPGAPNVQALPAAPPPPQEPVADAWVDYRPGWKKGWQSKKW